MFKRVPPLSRSWNGRFSSKEMWLVGTENIHHDHLCKSQIQSIPVIPVGHNWITACENWTCGRILTVLSSWPEKVRTQMIMKDEVHLFVPGMRYLLLKLKFCRSWSSQRMLFFSLPRTRIACFRHELCQGEEWEALSEIIKYWLFANTCGAAMFKARPSFLHFCFCHARIQSF